MSKSFTTSTTQRRTRRSVASRKKADRHATTIDHEVLVRNGKTTHVVVPVDEYQRLILLDMGRVAARKVDDPDEAFTDADQVALELAGKRIADARKAKRMTQKALGEKLHLPQSRISRIERNPDRTSLKTLRRIARALGVDVRALI